MIRAGQGVLYAQASAGLVALAELLQAPVFTTVDGLSAFPEDNPLSLGTIEPDVARPARTFSPKPMSCSPSAPVLSFHPLVSPRSRSQAEDHPRHQQIARLLSPLPTTNCRWSVMPSCCWKT